MDSDRVERKPDFVVPQSESAYYSCICDLGAITWITHMTGADESYNSRL